MKPTPAAHRYSQTIRVIVCGGRHYSDIHHVQQVLSRWWEESASLAGHNPGRVTIVHGKAPGADQLAATVGEEMGFWSEPHGAKWKLYGRAAGPIRNKEMADAGASLCIAFPGNNGTASMIGLAGEAGIPVRRSWEILQTAAPELEPTIQK